MHSNISMAPRISLKSELHPTGRRALAFEHRVREPGGQSALLFISIVQSIESHSWSITGKVALLAAAGYVRQMRIPFDYNHQHFAYHLTPDAVRPCAMCISNMLSASSLICLCGELSERNTHLLCPTRDRRSRR